MTTESGTPRKFDRIDDIPFHWARHTPDAVALEHDDYALTYAALARRIEHAMEILTAAGLRSSQRALLVTENAVGAVCFLFAAARLGAAFVLVNARLSAGEIDAIIEHCDPQVELYFDTGYGAGMHHATRRSARIVDFDLRDTILMHVRTQTGDSETQDPRVASFIYTSGTTGKPKGVMLSHGGLLFVAETMAAFRHLDATDKSYAVLPISHAMGLTSVLLSTLSAGAAVVIRERFDVEPLLQDLQDKRITLFQGAQAMYLAILNKLKTTGQPLPRHRLRYIYAGGAPLDPTLKREIEAVFGLPLHNGYGMTESSPTICHSRFGQWRDDVSVGPCLPGLEIRIVNAEGRPVSAGETGELCVRGPNVMLGYYRDPALTAATVRDGWLHTGDLARCDADGDVHLTGRIKDIIIRSGFNVYPAEVETALNSHASIEASVVVGRTANLNEEVVAFVKLRTGSPLTAHEILDYLKDRISPYKRPGEIIFLDEFPLMANGKVNRTALKALAQGRVTAPVETPIGPAR